MVWSRLVDSHGPGQDPGPLEVSCFPYGRTSTVRSTRPSFLPFTGTDRFEGGSDGTVSWLKSVPTWEAEDPGGNYKINSERTHDLEDST